MNIYAIYNHAKPMGFAFGIILADEHIACTADTFNEMRRFTAVIDFASKVRDAQVDVSVYSHAKPVGFAFGINPG